ncbi:MAG: helix-turn-helix domain-containing protein [Geodermatophilaceae bacterium]|nr:helix-turn-helix domain-containing protein [Geodermatophilaceae bacterium]
MASQSRPGPGGSRAGGNSGDPARPQGSADPARRGPDQANDEPRTIGENSYGGLSSVAFLTVAEVASLMRVSKMTVYRLLHSGELAGVRVGRSFRVPESAVHNYLRDAFNDTA